MFVGETLIDVVLNAHVRNRIVYRRMFLVSISSLSLVCIVFSAVLDSEFERLIGEGFSGSKVFVPGFRKGIRHASKIENGLDFLDSAEDVGNVFCVCGW